MFVKVVNRIVFLHGAQPGGLYRCLKVNLSIRIEMATENEQSLLKLLIAVRRANRGVLTTLLNEAVEHLGQFRMNRTSALGSRGC